MAIGSPLSSTSFIPLYPPPPPRPYRFRRIPSPLRLDSIQEIPEYDGIDLNLGAESPGSVMLEVADGDMTDDEWAKSGIAVHTNVPSRNRTWRSSSFSKKRGRSLKKELVDRDCGICFEVSVLPRRTSCCGKLFCMEHIADWLHGSSSDGLCPSCEAPCSLETDTVFMASPSFDLMKQSFGLPSPCIHQRSYRSSPSLSPLSITPSTSTGPSAPTSSSNSEEEDSWAQPDHLPILGVSFSSETFEILSRLTSIVGLTLFLYVLFT